jgi:hypothetical protein
MQAQNTIVPIYSSKGDVGAFLSFPYIFDRMGDWIGWVTPDQQVYSVHGQHVGWLTSHPRILRKLSADFSGRQTPPPAPQRLLVPATVPLAPMLPELTYGVIDVLDDAPELLPAIDFGEMREDMD